MSNLTTFKFDFNRPLKKGIDKYKKSELIDVAQKLNLEYKSNTTMETLYNNIKNYAQKIGIEPIGIVELYLVEDIIPKVDIGKFEYIDISSHETCDEYMIRKNQKKEVDINDNILNIINILINVVEENDNSKNAKFRIKTYKLLYNVIKKLPEKLISVEQIKGIEGLSKKSYDKINEILETGTLSYLTDNGFDISIYNNTNKIIDDLQKIHGIGTVNAKKIIEKYKITCIDDMINKFNNNIIKVKKNGLTKAMAIGIKYYYDLLKKIPRDEIDTISEIIKQYFNKIDENIIITVCGSYRRGCSYSKDVDILISHPNIITQEDVKNKGIQTLKMVIDQLKYYNILIDDLTTHGDIKYMGIYKLNDNPARRIDLQYIPYESYYFALLYFTGSGEFNKVMRGIASDRGFRLNEFSLYYKKTNKKVKDYIINSEKEIFDLLRINYVEPLYRHCI